MHHPDRGCNDDGGYACVRVGSITEISLSKPPGLLPAAMTPNTPHRCRWKERGSFGCRKPERMEGSCLSSRLNISGWAKGVYKGIVGRGEPRNRGDEQFPVSALRWFWSSLSCVPVSGTFFSLWVSLPMPGTGCCRPCLGRHLPHSCGWGWPNRELKLPLPVPCLATERWLF